MHMPVDESGQKKTSVAVHHFAGLKGAEAENPPQPDAYRAFADLSAEHIHDAHVVDAKIRGRMSRCHGPEVLVHNHPLHCVFFMRISLSTS